MPSYSAESSLFSSQDVFFEMKLQEAMALTGKQRSSMMIRMVGSILLDMEPRFALLGRFCMPAICGALGSAFTEVKASYLEITAEKSLHEPKVVTLPQLKPIPGVEDRSGYFLYASFESVLPSIDRLELQQYIRSQSYFDSVICLRDKATRMEAAREHYEEDLMVIYKRQSATMSTLERVLSLWRYETLRTYFFRLKLMLLRKKARMRFSRACVFFNRLRPGGPPASLLMHFFVTWRKYTTNCRVSRMVQKHNERIQWVGEYKHKISVHNKHAAEQRKRISRLKEKEDAINKDLMVRTHIVTFSHLCMQYTRTHAYTHICTPTSMRTRTHAHTQAHTHMHAYIYTCARMCNTYIHACIHRCTTHTYTHIRTGQAECAGGAGRV